MRPSWPARRGARAAFAISVPAKGAPAGVVRGGGKQTTAAFGTQNGETALHDTMREQAIGRAELATATPALGASDHVLELRHASRSEHVKASPTLGLPLIIDVSQAAKFR